MAELEPTQRILRPRQLVLHVTEDTYRIIDGAAAQRGVSKSTVLREILNAGAKAIAAKQEPAQ